MLRIKGTFATSDSNTTSVKVKRLSEKLQRNVCRIQIQPVLRLNPDLWERRLSCVKNSNTTNVKVKPAFAKSIFGWFSDSNTTNVKVKLFFMLNFILKQKHSNTTNVKVKPAPMTKSNFL